MSGLISTDPGGTVVTSDTAQTTCVVEENELIKEENFQCTLRMNLSPRKCRRVRRGPITGTRASLSAPWLQRLKSF